ncbi:unnamed protein product [Ixodes persulcatus]
MPEQNKSILVNPVAVPHATGTPTNFPLMNLHNYSNINRVIRITAWIQRFLTNASLPWAF